jgi:hypothetical protein
MPPAAVPCQVFLSSKRPVESPLWSVIGPVIFERGVIPILGSSFRRLRAAPGDSFLLLYPHLQGIGPNLQDILRYRLRDSRELIRHGRRKVDHPQTLALEPDLLQQLTPVFHPALCVYITFQVMAIAGQSTRDQDAVGALFEGAQDVRHIHPPGACDLNDLDRGRVLDA